MTARRRVFSWAVTASLLILLVSQLLDNGPFAGAAVAFAATKPQAAPGHLTFQQFLRLSHNVTNHSHFVRPTSAVPLPESPAEQHQTIKLLPAAEPPTMQPIKQSLSVAFLSGAPNTPPLDLLSSDHRLEVQLAPGSLDLSHASIAGSKGKNPPAHPSTTRAAMPTATSGPAVGPTPTATPTTTTTVTPTATPPLTPTATVTPPPVSQMLHGPFTLVITEQHGAFAGEWNMLGEYQLQIVDARGKPLSGIVLRHPLTIIYHYQRQQLTALDLDPGKLFLTWYDPGAKGKRAAQDIIPMRNNPVAHTLTAISQVLGPGPFDAGNGDPQNQSAPHPPVASVEGNSGQLSYSYPLQVAPAPDGFVPQLALSYSSGTTNAVHNLNSPASAVGEGWSLSLGSITAESYPSSSAGGAATWYFLNDVANVSDRLIQDPTISSGTFFQTEHISHLRIRQVTSNKTNEPCFNVWDESGTYYEFGCTQDSLQYRKDSNGTLHLYEWDLDEMIAPNEGSGSTLKEILVTYLQECGSQSGNCPSATSGSTTSIRDSGIEQIEYGTVPPGKTLSNGGTIAGTVDFTYKAPETVTSNGTTWATAYGTNYNCSKSPPKSTTLRCDDPLDYTGGNPAPTVMSTLTLQKVITSNGWYPLYEYDFTYQDTPFSSTNPATNNGSCADPTTNPPVLEYCAGEHLLTQITPLAYEGVEYNQSYPLKPTLFHYYAWFTNTYSDHSDPLPGGAVYSIAIDRELMDAYLDTNTGEGAHIDYERAYNNTHGTPTDPNTGDNRSDPLYCWLHPLGSSNDCSGVYSYPDDHAWTEQVVTQITAIGEDSSSLSPATTTYSYRLANTAGGNNCNGQCVGDNWLPAAGSNDDQDWADFYHGEFKGFNEVYTLSPSNDLTLDSYYSTKGWFTPESDASNYNSGHLSEQRIYRGPNEVDANLLQQTQWHYTGEDDNNSCDGNFGPTYVPCLAMAESSTTTDYEGTGSGNGSAPSVTTAYTYDDYNPTGGLSAYQYHNLDQETITSSNAPTVTKVWSYAPDDSGYPGSGWIEYDVNKVAHSEIDDSSGHKWDCQSFTYDELPTGGSPSLPEEGLVTTANSYSNSACTPPSFGTPMITTYTGYDASGNPVATVDGVATNTPAFYGSSGQNGTNGCTLSTAPVNMSQTWAQTLNKSNYTTCAVDDYAGRPTQVTNAFGQFTQTVYDDSSSGLPIQETDANSQTTFMTYTYDTNSGSNGTRYDEIAQPGESGGNFTTESYTSSSCPTGGLSGSTNLTPCYETDNVIGMYDSALNQTFYDAEGRVVETSAPTAVPAGGNSSYYYYTIQLTMYDDAAHTAWKSVPFIYASTSQFGGAGWLDPKASTTVDYEGKAPTGTMTYDDAMNRTIAVDDPLFGQTVNGVTYTGITCPSLGANATSCIVYELDQVDGGQGSDKNYYETTKAIDANNHVTEAFADMLGNTRYVQVDSGDNGNTLTPAKITATQYNVLNEATQVTVTDEQPQSGETTQSVTTSMSYDDLGRLITLVDPDRGTHNYSYDNDGHLTDDSSGSRTLGYNYDLLGRLGCEETAAPTANVTGNCSAGTPLIQNTYDTNELGTKGSTDFPTGRLTQSVSTTIYPDGTQSTSTESLQYDQRGRIITQQLALSLPSGWNISTPLPVYQLSQGYTDANQPESTQTSTIINQQQTAGYTVTQDYDPTSGALIGLSNNLGATPNVASLLLNENALPGSLTYDTSAGSGSIDASEQFSYDGDLRPQTDTATWGSGSGQSGQIFSESRWYDFAGNVVSLATTQASVPGQTGSGGSETENDCYNEQDELVWASNMTAPSPTSTETCGSQTPGNSLNGASYTTSYVYTNLGQLWQGPVAGGTTNEQYLYCTTAPHQLSGIYAIGSACSAKSGQQYKDSSYDAWGNVTGRTYNGTSETLAYDELDRMVKWTVNAGTNDYFAYDASGNRTVQRATSGGTTTLTVYAFGLEEYQYSGTGTLQNATHYYSLGGRLIGALTGLSSPVTVFYLSDALGNLLATFNNTQGAAAIQGNQVYGPYGNSLYSSGSMDTAKGYTGQYADALTGLDYYVSRYYDPVAGIFLSPDAKEGNTAGMNPYAYVGGNPETMTDPSGQMFGCPGCGNSGGGGDSQQQDEQYAFHYVEHGGLARSGLPVLLDLFLYHRTGWALAESYDENVMHGSTEVLLAMEAYDLARNQKINWNASLQLMEMFKDLNSIALPMLSQMEALSEHDPELAAEVEEVSLASVDDLMSGDSIDENGDVTDDGGPCSFTPATLVETNHGEQAIGTLTVGEEVLAYNPKTKKMEDKPILHVWIHTDHDLVDLTLTTKLHAPHSTVTTTASETIHTNKKHPFFTEEAGFLPVGQLKLGMHVLRADGRYDVITGYKLVPGTKVMYNLEVAQDHTFTVGSGRWVVHNCAAPNVGQQRVNYVRNNLDSLVQDPGQILGTNVDLMTNIGSTDVDIDAENAIIEVGGPMKNADLGTFSHKMQKLQILALQDDRPLYFAYDASNGPISSQLTAIANKWGATVIQFIP